MAAVAKRPVKEAEKKTTTSSFVGRLKSPDASVSLSSFSKHFFGVVIDAQIKNGKVSGIGFETDGPASFSSFLSRAAGLFMGKAPEELEMFSMDAFVGEVQPFPEEREFVLYAWTALQDVVTRLPQKDPMSKAINRISQIHKDFPLGEMGLDEED